MTPIDKTAGVGEQAIVVRGDPQFVTWSSHVALKELTLTQIDGVKGLIEGRLDQMDRRYQDRFDGQGKELMVAEIARLDMATMRAKRADDRFEAFELTVQRRFVASEKQVEVAMAFTQVAVDKAEKATEKRFDAVNEFRGALTDASARLIPRSEVEGLIRNVIDKIDGPNGLALQVRDLTARHGGRDEASAEAKAQRNWAIGIAVAVVAAALTLINHQPSPSQIQAGLSPAPVAVYQAAPPAYGVPPLMLPAIPPGASK